VGRRGNISIGIRCPVNHPAGEPGCRGVATLEGARGPRRYDVAPGTTKLVRFRLTRARVAALRREGRATLTAAATNEDALDGATQRRGIDVTKPLPPKRKRKRAKRPR
jgi:hypothetical protein